MTRHNFCRTAYIGYVTKKGGVMKAKSIFLFLAGMALLFTGCSKEDETAPEAKVPTVGKDSVLVTVPKGLKNSSDPKAAMVVQFFEGLNHIAGYANMMQPPRGAATFHSDVAGAVAYTWTDGSVSYWFIYHEENGKCYWEVDADFGEGRTKYITAEENCDHKSGKIVVWTGNLAVYSAEWNYLADNTLSFTIQSMEGGKALTVTGKLKPDDSGYAKVTMGGMTVMEIWWNADGSGHYKIYTTFPPTEGSWSSD
jgi:hypothetical protein